jgi:hypothetical protein
MVAPWEMVGDARQTTGEWELNLSKSFMEKKWFDAKKIEDVLFVLTSAIQTLNIQSPVLVNVQKIRFFSVLLMI